MVTKTWNGNNADWFTSADWSGGSNPGIGDDAVINGGQVTITGADPAVSVNSIAVNASGSLYLAGGTISGGTLTGTGTIGTVGGQSGELSSVTIAGGTTFTVQNNSLATLLGTITNHGTILVSAVGNYTDLRLGGSSVTLTGGGIVQLSNDVNNRIFDPLGSATLVNVNNTIEGAGNIGFGLMSLDNQASGTINANQSAGLSLAPNSSGATNEGLIEATSGGVALPHRLAFYAVERRHHPGVWLELASRNEQYHRCRWNFDDDERRHDRIAGRDNRYSRQRVDNEWKHLHGRQQRGGGSQEHNHQSRNDSGQCGRQLYRFAAWRLLRDVDWWGNCPVIEHRKQQNL